MDAVIAGVNIECTAADIDKSFARIFIIIAVVPSVPTVMLKVPYAMRTLSLPERPCFSAVILYVPLVSTRSSLDTMPCPASAVMFSVPFPFKVRSSLEKMTASILLSSMAVYVPPSQSIFRTFGHGKEYFICLTDIDGR